MVSTLNEAVTRFDTIPAKHRLDIGSGAQQKPGESWVALDIVKTFRPDVMGDAHRLPFADGSLRAVKAHHVLEHIPRDYFVFHWLPMEDETPGPASYLHGYTIKAGSRSYIEARRGLVDVMNEMWRVLAVGGQAWIEVPVFPTEEAIADPTHGSFLTSGTFAYFTRCDDHRTDDMAHMFTCREEHRRMYGCKPWRMVKAEKVNHARIFVCFMEKLEDTDAGVFGSAAASSDDGSDAPASVCSQSKDGHKWIDARTTTNPQAPAMCLYCRETDE